MYRVHSPGQLACPGRAPSAQADRAPRACCAPVACPALPRAPSARTPVPLAPAACCLRAPRSPARPPTCLPASPSACPPARPTCCHAPACACCAPVPHASAPAPCHNTILYCDTIWPSLYCNTPQPTKLYCDTVLHPSASSLQYNSS